MKINFKKTLLLAITLALGFGQNTFAQNGNFITFDGTSQYMKVATAAALNVGAGQSLTITFKVKHNAAATNARYFAKRATSDADKNTPGLGGVGYEAFYNAGRVGPNARTAGANVGGGFNTETSMNNGAWHHVAMVFDNTTPTSYVTRLSVDGVMTNSGTASNIDLSNAVEFVVAAASDYSNKLAGSMDDIRVYNKAFNATDITNDKNTLAVNNTTPNLVAAWDFEGVVGANVPDASGNGNTGTLVGNPMITPNFGLALSLDGSTQYMRVAHDPAFNIANGETKTITMWVKIPATGGNNPSYLYSKMNGQGAGYETFVGSTNASSVAANVRTSQASGTNVGVLTYATPSPTLNSDTWRHVAAVITMVDGQKVVQLYVDGTPVGTNTATVANSSAITNTVDLIFGAKSNPTPTIFFKGIIDEIHVWNKAMTQADVLQDKATLINGPAADLVAAWNFENVSGTTVADLSGNSRNGQLIGNPTILDLNSNNMQFVSTNIVQTVLPSAKGLTDQKVIAAKVTVAGTDNPISLTALNFTMNGTTNIADVSSIKVYYTGSASRFNTSSLFATVSPAAGALVANGSQVLASGDNYFFIAYDVKSSTAEGNLLDATCESVTVGGTVQSISSNNPAGNRVVLLENTLLVKPGDAGSVSYRIPAVTTAKDGSLVAVVDKRWNHSGDLSAKIDPIAMRSTDGGRTWSAPVVIANFGGSSGAGDAALVTDKNTGDIVCLVAANRGFFSSTNANPIDILMIRSKDNGITWEAPVKITDQIYSATLNSGWRGVFVASGRMHQLRNGNLVAAIAVREDVSGSEKITNHLITSTDGGYNWTASTAIAEVDGDEAKVVELNNGDLLMSIRNPGSRRFNKSNDQGITWGTPYNQSDISDPNCDGDIIRYTSTLDGYDKNRLLHSIPFAGNRSNVSVLLSTDEGNSWPVRKTIFSGASAYSSLTILDDGTIGIYYENGENGAVYDMYFTRFSLNWLTNGADTYTPSPLPLKLVDFGANYNKASKQIKTTWQTQSEVNVNRFEVEYATDGTNFSKAGSINAKANNLNGTHLYSFNFQSNHTGIIYVRLKMIDNDGTATYSKVKTVVVAAQNGLMISPNPVKNVLNIQTTLSTQGELHIINTIGATVKKAQLTKGNSSIDVSSLPKGVYTAQLKVGGQTFTEKFIKE